MEDPIASAVLVLVPLPSAAEPLKPNKEEAALFAQNLHTAAQPFVLNPTAFVVDPTKRAESGPTANMLISGIW